MTRQKRVDRLEAAVGGGPSRLLVVIEDMGHDGWDCQGQHFDTWEDWEAEYKPTDDDYVLKMTYGDWPPAAETVE